MAVAGDINIRQPIVVVISDGNPGGPAPGGQPRSLGHVGEVRGFPVAVLPVERDHGIATGKVTVDRGIVHNGDVQFAVVFTIHEGDSSAAHRFDDVAPVEIRVRNSANSNLRRNVTKQRHRGLRELLERGF